MNAAADAYCVAMLRHYENFTVASRLAPRALRRDLARIYAFARTTDDLGDESSDCAVATRRGRTYLLQCDLRDGGERGAVRAMCERARALLASGRELEAMVPPRLRLQLALYRLGGEAILDAIARAHYDTAKVRPTVSRRARVQVALSSLIRAAGLGPGPVAAGGSAAGSAVDMAVERDG